MCSIIGASSKEKNIPFGDLKILYLQGESRGGDACGFTNGDKAIKKADDSYDFVNKIMKRDDFPKENKMFIGHTRYATIGNSKKDENAHPFAKKNIIGVHNGSIFNHEDLADISNSDSEVDSEILYDCIAKFGFKKTLPLLSGILALCWYNREKETIYIYRLGRPLFYGKKEGIMYWGSEKHYLESVDCEDIKEFQQHTLYQIRDGKIVHSGKLKKVLTPSLPNLTDNDKIIKKSTLNIFEEKKEHLKSLKDDHVDQLLEDYESIKKQKKEKETEKTKEEKKDRSIIVYGDTSMMKPPMNAELFPAEDGSDNTFVWFDQQTPYMLTLWQENYGMFREYDLTQKSDQMNLLDEVGSDSEILEWVQNRILSLDFIMEKRNEIFNEDNPTKVLDSILV